MDLKSFSNTEPYSAYRDPEILKEKPKEETKEKPMTEKDVKDAIGTFSKMSNDQLMVEFAKQIASQKQKGNTSNMLQTIERIKPMLNADQQKKLGKILEQVDM